MPTKKQSKQSTKKELKEENEKLKARLADGDKVDEWLELIATHVLHAQELNAEIEELTDFMPDGYKFYLEQGVSMNDIIEKLKEENEDLKKEIVNISTIKNKQIKKEKDKYESMCSEQAESDCAKYINELQEENEKFKKINKKLAEQMKVKDDNWDLAMKNEEELKEENENLKKQIPDKKGKKLSQADKEVLGLLMDDAISLSPLTNDEEAEKAPKYNLLKRLLK